MSSEFLHIDSIAYGGEAVGRLASGKVCFVPGGLPGELLEVEIIQEKNSYSRARVLNIVEASPARVTPPCPAYREHDCPGCAYLHCTYDLELESKQRQLCDFLTRDELLGDGVLLPPFPSPVQRFYRNKLKLRSDGSSFAMVARDNESLIKTDSCLLADANINAAVKNSVVPLPDETLCWRYTSSDGVKSFPGKSCRRDTPWLTEVLPGIGSFKVPLDGFFQTNIAVASELVFRVVTAIRRSGLTHLVELYCGVGIFSIAAAAAIPELTALGIELNPAAIKAARWNARKHGLDKRCTFFSGDAAKELKKSGDISGSCLLVDPPRSGLSALALNNIIAADPAKIIYISCAADTLRRDLIQFKRANWRIETAALLDMFPKTAHFETVVVLKR